jgi:hypothetical protein
MSISQNFPDEGPTLNLNFAGSRTLDPRITFTRTSSGTYLGDNGLIKIAAANSPRFDHSYNPTTGEIESLGLLVEEARTNLLLRSEDFSATWVKSSDTVLTTDIDISPDGQNTADKLSAGTSNFPQIAQQVTPPSFTSVHTFSVFVKSAGIPAVQLRVRNASAPTNYFRALFDLTTGQVSIQFTSFGNGVFISYDSKYFGNGWWRFSITGTADTTGTILQPLVILQKDLLGTVADSTNSSPTDGVLLWGAQLEEGSFPTSYIPTTASTVTRSADSATMTGTNFSSWYNPSEGTILAQALHRRLYDGVDRFPRIASIRQIEASVADSIELIYAVRVENQTSAVPGIRVNNVLVASPFFVGEHNNKKQALAYAVDNVIGASGGTLSSLDTSANIPIVNMLLIGRSTAIENINGTIAQLTYYPTRLPNNILQNLTR